MALAIISWGNFCTIDSKKVLIDNWLPWLGLSIADLDNYKYPYQFHDLRKMPWWFIQCHTVVASVHRKQGPEGVWLIIYMYVLVFDQIKLCLKWLQLHAMHGHWSWKRGNSPKHLSTIQYIIISCTFKLLQRAKSRTIFKRQCSKDCMFTHTTSHYNLKMFKLLWHTHLYSWAQFTMYSLMSHLLIAVYTTTTCVYYCGATPISPLSLS